MNLTRSDNYSIVSWINEEASPQILISPRKPVKYLIDIFIVVNIYIYIYDVKIWIHEKFKGMQMMKRNEQANRAYKNYAYLILIRYYIIYH